MRPVNVRLNVRRIALGSPLVAVVVQLLTAAVAIASTTGGGFPGLQK